MDTQTATRPATAAEIHAAAVQRKRARESRDPDYRKEQRDALLEGRPATPLPSAYRPMFTPPTSLGEWLDDQLTCHTWAIGEPWAGAVLAIAEAARGSAAAAAREVRGARQLAPAAQYLAYAELISWRQRLTTTIPGAAYVMTAVMNAWHKAGLATEPPKRGKREAH